MMTITRRFFITVLLCCFSSVASFLFAEDADVDVAITVVPRATYFLSDFEDSTTMKEVASITIINRSDEDLQLKARILISSEKVGDTISDYTTNYKNFPIDVPAKGTYVIANNEVTDGMLRGGVLRIDPSETEALLTEAYQEEVLKSGGLVPEDTYTYSVYLFDKDANEYRLSNAIASVSDSIYIPLEYGNIDLIYPDDAAILPITNEYPEFLWSPLTVRQGVGITYTLSIWEVESDNYEAAQESRPIAEVEVEDETRASYPAHAESLKLNQTYLWRVTAVDETNTIIGLGNNSDVHSFKFGDISAPRLSDPSLSIDAFPVQLMWESDAANMDYRVLISKQEDLRDPILEEVVSVPFLQISDPSLFEPGVVYYWAVFFEDVDSDEIRSDIGTLQIKSSIELIYPLDDQIDSDSVTLYWTGAEGLSYQVKVSTDSDFRVSKIFTVDENSLMIDDSAISFKPGYTYYWTVQALDQYNKPWGDEGDVGEFYLSHKDAPAAIFPNNDTIEQEEISFIFSPVDWATNYRVSIYDPKNMEQALFEERTDSSPYFIDLSALAIDSDELLWVVAGVSEEGDYVLPSEEARFRLDREPRELEIISYPEQLEEGGRIKWKGIKRAETYKVLFATDEDFSQVKQIMTDRASISLDAVDIFEDMFFKVLALGKNREIIAESYPYIIKVESEDEESDDRNEEEEETVLLMSPKGKLGVASPWVFRWLPPGEEATVLISDTDSFGNAASFEARGNVLNPRTIEYSFEVGKKYYWTVVQDDQRLDYFESFELTPQVLKLINPLSQTLSSSEVLFQWLGSKEGDYEVHISRHPEMRRSKKIEVSETRLRYKVTKPGDYYWRVVQKLEGSRQVMESSIGRFRVEEKGAERPTQLSRELEFFIKQLSRSDSSLRASKWKLEGVRLKGGGTLTEEEVKFLIENKDQVIRVIEQ